ncbi:hypothetical protein D6C81_10299 [Aureobasidium pullulans]|nr:hypothetical protein D6C81_10299 [Aureobasidium pullulans]
MSTLTEFTEDLEFQLQTPTSIPSSPADRVSQDDGANNSSCASPTSTLTAFSGDNHACTSSFPPLLTSLYTLTDLEEISNPFSVSMSPASSMSALTEFSEYASSISTLTDFTSVASSSTLSSPPSSLSSLPPTPSTPIPTRPQRAHRHRKRSHRNMICMSDGSEWLPPTLERVQAYIASQGSRRLARSARRVVEQKVRSGSKVAREYERDILKVDLKVWKQRGQ